MPALALTETRFRCVVVRNVRPRLLIGQAVRLSVDLAVGVDGKINLVILYATDNKCRVCLFAASEKFLVRGLGISIHPPLAGRDPSLLIFLYPFL